jgi:hypothetical protein
VSTFFFFPAARFVRAETVSVIFVRLLVGRWAPPPPRRAPSTADHARLSDPRAGLTSAAEEASTFGFGRTTAFGLRTVLWATARALPRVGASLALVLAVRTRPRRDLVMMPASARRTARSLRDWCCWSRSFADGGGTAGAAERRCCFFGGGLGAARDDPLRRFLGLSSFRLESDALILRLVPLSSLETTAAAFCSLEFSSVLGPRTPRQFSDPHRHFWVLFSSKGLALLDWAAK